MTGPRLDPVSDRLDLLRTLSGPQLTVSRGAFARSQLSIDTATNKLGSYFARRRSPDLFDNEEAALDALLQQRIDLGLQKWRETDPARRESLSVALAYNARAVAEQRAAIEAAQYDDGRLISPDQLTAEYGHLGLTFDAPMTPAGAAALAGETRRAQIQEQIAARAPRGITTAAVGFGANIIASATDPIELASAFIPVVGPAGRAALGVNAATRAGRIAGRAKVGAIQGATGAALLEPLYYGLSRDAQLDYEMSDVLTNIGIGAILGGGGGVISGALSRSPLAIVNVDADIEAPGSPPVLLLPEPDRPTIAGLLPPPAIVPPVDPSAANIARLGRALGVADNSEIAATALRQFLNDDPIDVTPLMRSVLERPPTLTDWARGYYVQRGDLPADVTADDVRSFIAARGDDEITALARGARSAGYIDRDADFRGALERDGAGDLVFAGQDAEAVADWRDWSGLPDETFDTTAAIRQIKRDYPGIKRKRPTTDYLKSLGGIRPGTLLAADLNARGVTARNTPGLFRKNGLGDIDNIPADEYGDGGMRSLPLADDGFYIDREALIDAIVSEQAGTPVYQTLQEQDAVRRIADLEAYGKQLGKRYSVDIEAINRVADAMQPSPNADVRYDALQFARAGDSVEVSIAKAWERLNLTDRVADGVQGSRQALIEYLARLGETNVGAGQIDQAVRSMQRGREFVDAMRDAGIDIQGAQARALARSAQQERPADWIYALMLREQGTVPPSGAGRLERPFPRARAAPDDAAPEPPKAATLVSEEQGLQATQAPRSSTQRGDSDDLAGEFAIDEQIVADMREQGQLSDAEIAELDEIDDAIAQAEVEDAAMLAMAECMVITKGQI